jgi:hypothetical protein
MKTTLDLPDDLVRQLKLRAIHEGKKLKDAVADTLRAGLAAPRGMRSSPTRRPERGRVVIGKDHKTGLPVIQCPADAPARRMTPAQLLALEHETQTREDLERLGIPVRQ